MMRTVFLCMVTMLLVSGCVTQMDAEKIVSEQVDPQISKLKNQLAVIEMTYSQLDEHLAALKDDLTASKADMAIATSEVAAQNEASAETLTGIKAIVEKAVRALDAKISQVEAGMSKMKADIAAAATAAQAPAVEIEEAAPAAE